MSYVSSLIEVVTDDGRTASVDVNTITVMVSPYERAGSGKTKIYHTDGFLVAGYNRDQVVKMVEDKRRELWEAQQAQIKDQHNTNLLVLMKILEAVTPPKTITLNLDDDEKKLRFPSLLPDVAVHVVDEAEIINWKESGEEGVTELLLTGDRKLRTPLTYREVTEMVIKARGVFSPDTQGYIKDLINKTK